MIVSRKNHFGLKVVWRRCPDSCFACRRMKNLLMSKQYRVEAFEFPYGRDKYGWLSVRNESQVVTRYSAKHFEVIDDVTS